MKTMIKIFTMLLIMTFAANLESHAGTNSGGNRPRVKVLGKKRKISKMASLYSLRFNTVDINRRPKHRRR